MPRFSFRFLRGRENVLLFGLGLLVVGGLILLDLLGTHRARERALLEAGQRLQAQATSRSRALESRSKLLVNEVLFLSMVPPVQGMARASLHQGMDPQEGSSYAQWRRRLTNIFASYASTAPELMQIRLIGIADGGREIVRVDRVADRTVVVPDSSLQRKGDRPYFRSTLLLPHGKVGVSPLELNVEHGRVQIPKAPTLRASTPVYGPDGKIFGVVIVNLDAKAMLAEFRQSIPSPFQLYLTNDAGDFLSHPDPDREFGMDMGTPWRWTDEFGRLVDRDSLQSVKRVSSPGSLLVYRKTVHYDAQDSQAHWSVVTALTDSAMKAQVDHDRRFALLLSGFIALSGAAILYLFVVGVLRRVQARESQARLGAIVDGSPDAIVGLSRSGRITNWNRMAREMFGCAEDKVVGELLVEVLAFADQAGKDLLQTLCARAAEGEAANGILRFSNGAEPEIETIAQVAIHPVHGEESGVAALAATFRDITEQERARRQIVELNQNLETQVVERTRHIEELSTLQTAILEYAGWAIVATDREGLIRVFNRAAEGLLGWTSAEMFGKSPLEFHDPSEMAALVGEIRRREGWDLEGVECLLAGLEKEGAQLREWTWVRKDGTRFPVLLSISLLKDAHGVPLGFICIGQDLTERRRMEEALRERTREAEAAGRAKSEFLANMSHEIRTPLNGVLGLAAALERRDLEPFSRELVGKIRQSGDLLRTLIDDILDMSKIEAGHLELEAAVFKLDEVLDNLGNLVAGNAGKKGLELVVGAVPPGLSRLVGDSHRLQQVLMNLVGNAIKFTAHGSVVVGIEDMGESEGHPTVRFSVRDTGEGIAPEALPLLFQPFTQADASTTRRFGGTGLGLAISRMLVEKMDGSIEVESEPGKGTLVRFTARFQRPESEPPGTGRLRHLDVLVVDDSEPSRSALAMIATSIGWKAEERDGGQGALEAVMDRQDRGRGFDVLLLDWKMPGLDGLATARVVRELLRSETPPVVLLATAYSLDELDQVPGKELVDGVLVKPVTGSRLFDAVSNALQRKGQAIPVPVAVAPTENRFKGLRILIVDDNEINRDVGSLLCREEGAQVLLANDGKEALEALETDPAIDVVLMDVQMPGMDGCEATRRIRAMPGRASLPIIALTAGVLPEEREAAREAGVDAFVGKPFLGDDLVRAVLVTTGQASHSGPSAAKPDRFPVFDLAPGLSIWKRPELLREQLDKFVGQYRDAGTEVAQALEQGDPERALFLVHRLRSASGFLGLMALSEDSLRLERTIRAADDWTDRLREFVGAMDSALRAVDAWRPGAGA